jgi:benzoyl-CoA reductase/2-hydroxyglutaryl-CoA dehydratase subunit BcrC/BadD/HgdB
LAWFANMVQNCYDYATEAKGQGRGLVGILCEYTPRELIMAADALPVCLCGGSEAKIAPAEDHLPANLCPLIKSTYGYHLTGSNPFLEMADLVVAETTCDGKKKMYELMGQTRRMCVMELPQKSEDADARAHWLSQLRHLRATLETDLQVKITDPKLREAIGVMNTERRLRRDLAALMQADCPPLTGRQLLDCKSLISGNPADVTQYEILLEQLTGTAGRRSGAAPVRVLLTGVPTAHGAEKVVDIIEARGGLVVCMENCTGLKPIWEDVDESAADPLEALADKYFHLPCSVMTPNDGRLALIRQLTEIYRPECVVDLVWQACLTYDVESRRVRELAEKELGLPYLKIVTDYSPSDTARINLRVEALFETARAQGRSR